MPSQFYGTPLLPKPMQEAHRTLKLGDSRRVNEQDWDTLYHDDYNTSVRIPISLETLKTQTERSPHRHTSGYILTSISRPVVQDIREQILPEAGIAAAKQAAAIFKDADPKNLGIMSQAVFSACLERAGICLSNHDLQDMMQKFAVRDGVSTIKAVDYIDFLCNVVPEAYN